MTGTDKLRKEIKELRKEVEYRRHVANAAAKWKEEDERNVTRQRAFCKIYF